MKSSKIVSGASKNPYLSITHSSAQRVWPAHPGMNVVSSLSTIFQSSLVPYCRPHRCGTTSSRSCFPRRLDVEAYAAFHHRKLELPTFQNPLDVNSSSVLLRQCRNSNYWVVEKILTCSRGSHIFSGQGRFWSPSQPQKIGAQSGLLGQLGICHDGPSETPAQRAAGSPNRSTPPSSPGQVPVSAQHGPGLGPQPNRRLISSLCNVPAR